MWFGIIWIIMYVGHWWNTNTFFVIAKVALFATAIAFFFSLSWPLEWVFAIANKLLRTEWDAREWTFRVTLDLFIVYGGMLAALAFIKAKEYGLTDSTWFPSARRGAIGTSVFALIGFFLFELSHVKTDYNRFHPYVSIIPILAYCVLRNASPLLRSTSSRFFIFIGHW
jgi:N-acetylneuraminate 9-O-acetyltransferase